MNVMHEIMGRSRALVAMKSLPMGLQGIDSGTFVYSGFHLILHNQKFCGVQAFAFLTKISENFIHHKNVIWYMHNVV